MENNNDSSIFGLSITQKLKDDFKTAATWALITAVIAFVNAGITLIKGLKAVSAASLFGIIISIGISVMLNVFLLNFARKMKAGINEDNQEQVNDSLNNLRIYFKITGILIIVGLVICTLAIIIAILGSAMR